MHGLFVKKVHVLNKNIVHLIDDIFWNCGFKTDSHGDQVIIVIIGLIVLFAIIGIYFYYWTYCNYLTYSVYCVYCNYCNYCAYCKLFTDSR